MRRRSFCMLAAAIASALPTAPTLAADEHTVDYTRAAYDGALASGEPFLLDFFAPW